MQSAFVSVQRSCQISSRKPINRPGVAPVAPHCTGAGVQPADDSQRCPAAQLAAPQCASPPSCWPPPRGDAPRGAVRADDCVERRVLEVAADLP